MPSSLRAPRDIDDLLSYRLFRLYSVGGAPAVRLLEGRYGISRREMRVIALLALHGDMSPSELAARGQLDRPSVSRGVRELVEKRLAERTATPGDARRARVVLTESGRTLYEELFPQIAAIDARVASVLDDAALASLDAALAVLTAEAERLNREIVRDVRADRRAGGSRRVWRQSERNG